MIAGRDAVDDFLTTALGSCIVGLPYFNALIALKPIAGSEVFQIPAPRAEALPDRVRRRRNA